MRAISAISLAILTFSSVSDAYGQWSPCGGPEGDLWSWSWAGESGENVTIVEGGGGPRITDMRDLSGNGHHYSNHTGSNQPAFQTGLELDGYRTTLPIIAVDRYADGSQAYGQWMNQAGTMSAAGTFYLVFAGMNTRGAGHRHLWGRTWNDLVRLDQGRDRANIFIDGVEHLLSDSGSIPKGPILLEIWRDEDNVLHTWVNGKDVSLAGAASAAIFRMTGIGWSGDGTGGWDDYAFEYVACDGLPAAQQRSDVREHLRQKWGLYGESVYPAKPKSPADIKVD
jgi:hypothetical protein